MKARLFKFVIITTVISGLFFAINASTAKAQEAATVTQQVRNLIVPPDARIPELNVPIPGLDLSSGVKVEEGSNDLRVNLLGLYINAVYTWLITAASIIAVVMMMIAGLQYATAAGNTTSVMAARDRMKNVVIGMLLLLGANAIATFMDPRLTVFESLSIVNIEGIQLDQGTTGNEGMANYASGTGTWENLRPEYKSIVQDAKSGGKCYIPELLSSPTGKLPNQGNHHWYDHGANGEWAKIKNLDWAAGWGTSILAPFNGTVTYGTQTNASNKCGNRIYLKSSTGNDSITICHVKDFLDESGVYEASRVVEQGDVIGHVGGVCCAGGGETPTGWITKCTAPGTECTDPKTGGSCSCQPISQSGNTSGPHVHITWSGGSNILACLE